MVSSHTAEAEMTHENTHYLSALRGCDRIFRRAVIVGKPGVRLESQNILAVLKTMLANFKIPKRCVVVTELPRNAMGKVQKNLLRAQYANPT